MEATIILLARCGIPIAVTLTRASRRLSLGKATSIFQFHKSVCRYTLERTRSKKKNKLEFFGVKKEPLWWKKKKKKLQIV